MLAFSYFYLFSVILIGFFFGCACVFFFEISDIIMWCIFLRMMIRMLNTKITTSYHRENVTGRVWKSFLMRIVAIIIIKMGFAALSPLWKNVCLSVGSSGIFMATNINSKWPNKLWLFGMPTVAIFLKKKIVWFRTYNSF